MITRRRGETVVAIGKTDGHRFVGVTLPLDSHEINTLQWIGALDLRFPVDIVDEFEPSCTLVSVVANSASDSPEVRDSQVNEVATRIAGWLNFLRSGRIRFEPEPVYLNGANSTPFAPNTAT